MRPDSRGRRGGFRATYVAKSVACAVTRTAAARTCDDGGTSSHDAADSGRAAPCTVPHCLDGAPKVTGESMVIVSRAPGEPVPAAADCTWEFQAPAGESVSVVVETLDLEPYRSAAKEGDKVVIRSAGAADIELTSTSFQNPTTSRRRASASPSRRTERRRRDVRRLQGDRVRRRRVPRRWRRLYGSGLHVRADERVTGPGLLRRGSRGGLRMRLDGVPGGQLLRRIDGRLRGLSPRDVQERDRPAPCEPCPTNFYAPESGAAMCCRHGYVLVDGFCRQCGQNVGAYVLRAQGATRRTARPWRRSRSRSTLLSFQSRVDVRLSMSGRRRRLQGLFSGTGGVW